MMGNKKCVGSEEVMGVAEDFRLALVEQNDLLNKTIAERTEARAEAFRAQERVRELEAEVERGRQLIERDRTGMATALNKIRTIAKGYGWIPDGELGSYAAAGCGEGEELTEDVLRKEVGYCLCQIRAVATVALSDSGDCVNEMLAAKRREGK